MDPHRAFIIGGGLGGMTVAKELVARGFKVFLFEGSDRLGGKAGADRVGARDFGTWPEEAATGPVASLPQEHGYHIFPGWYRNTRTLLADLGLADTLIDLHRFYHLRRRYSQGPAGPIERALRRVARAWRATTPPVGPMEGRFTIFEETWPLSNLLLNVIDGPTRPHLSLVYFYVLLDLASRPMSQADHLDRISANGFLSARLYVAEDVARFQHQTVLQASAIPNYEISAMTLQRLTRLWLQVPRPMVSILPANLQDAFIDPFAAHLARHGVTIRTNVTVAGLEASRERRFDQNGNVRVRTAVQDLRFADGTRLSALLGALDPGRPRLDPDDVFVLATPLERARALLDGGVDALERRKEDSDPRPLADLDYLRAVPMAGLHLYCERTIEGLPDEHVFLTDSRFGLSLIEVSRHWRSTPAAGSVLSVIASDFESLRSVYASFLRGGAGEEAAKRYVARLLIEEVADYLDLGPCRYFITPNVDRPLFLNTVGAWSHRPGTTTRFANLYVAGDYCRSEADLTSMEGAVTSGLETAGQILSDRHVMHTLHALPLNLPAQWKLRLLQALMSPVVLPFGLWNAGGRLLRRLTMNARWFLVNAPYSQADFATSFRATEATGTEFFRVFAERRNYDHEERAQTGLMRSLDDLASKAFEPATVHPLIREFYERTFAFDMRISIRWHHVFKPLGFLYQWLVARPMRNLVIPLGGALDDLDSWLETIDKDWDGEADYTIWIRVQKGSTMPVYVGAYRTYRSRRDDLSYVSVVFPVPLGNLTTVLVPTNLDGGGFQLYTRHPGAKEAGVYVLFPGERRFSMTPTPLSERFQLRADGETIRVSHLTWAFGLRAITIDYEITRKRARAEATWETLRRTVDARDRRW